MKQETSNVELPYQVPNDIGNVVWWTFLTVLMMVALMGIVSGVYLEGWKSGLIILILAFCGLLGLLKLHPCLLLTEEGICYREFFFCQRVAWVDIRKIRTLLGTRLTNFRTYPHMRIQHNGKDTANLMVIGLRVFSAVGLARFVETLSQKCPEVMVNDKTSNMLAGRMPSMFDDLLDEYKAKNEK